MFTADNWCVKVNEKVFGPYSSQQLRKFAHEGRLAEWSLIAPAGSKAWRKAKEENAFASFFGVVASESSPTIGRTFGRQDTHETESASIDARQSEPQTTIEQARRPGEARRAKPIGQRDAPRAHEPAGPANFVVIFDVVSGAAGRISSMVASLGPSFRIADNVWSVNCSLTAIGVRNALAPYLRPNESIFVVDASNGRASWQNYAPEAHSKITAAYVTPRRN